MTIFRPLISTTSMTCLALALAACTEQAVDEQLEPEDLDPLENEDGKFEAWNSSNNPAYVDSTFLYRVNQLPVSGTGKAPIPGDYWATARDSLNYKWDGSSSLSPAAKYAKVFGRSSVPDQVSQANGVKGASTKTCTTNADCTSQMDGSSCVASYDGTVKKCVPGWWGICHGWAPYALMEPAARNPVTRTAPDGTQVTFYPGDLEGLMSMLYTNVQTKFISSRCNKKDPPFDANGRLINGECRDMNPGTWHIVTTNLMGLRKQGFVLDQTYDVEVWNQPGRDYVVTNAVGDGLKEITKAEALALLGIEGTLTSLIADTEIAKDAQRTGSFTATNAGAHRFKMAGTGDADLYVRKGSAPTLDAYDCRPYEGGSIEECPVDLAAGETVHWMINGYAASSRVSLGIAAPGTGTADYIYNPAAERFFHVEMDYRFIVESSPARTSHIDQVDQYTTTKHYSYILETDEFMKILGGEWIGDSRSDHPDFAWWPTATPSSQTAGILYSDVKALNTEAAGGLAPVDTVTVIDNYTINTSGGTWKSRYGTVQVEAGVKSLKVTMTGTGDAELYVRKGSNPTVYTYGCKSSTAGTSNETCSVNVSASGGTYYVRARTKTTATVTVVAEKVR